MMKTSFLAAAAATAMLIAAPALAAPAATKHMTQSTAKSKQANAKHTKHVQHQHMSRRSTYRPARVAYGNDWNRPAHSGFAPFDFAGDVVGGAIGAAGVIAGTAVGTAGAIAAAPFGDGPYAYGEPSELDYAYNDGYAPYGYNGTALQYSPSYAARNGFVCHPGTWFKDENGRQRICQ